MSLNLSNICKTSSESFDKQDIETIKKLILKHTKTTKIVPVKWYKQYTKARADSMLHILNPSSKPVKLRPFKDLGTTTRNIITEQWYELVRSKFRYVSYHEFIASSYATFDKFFAKLKGDEKYIIPIQERFKSTTWMLFLMMEYATKIKHAVAMDVIRRTDLIVIDDWLEGYATIHYLRILSSPTAKYQPKILAIDDASYSGLQIMTKITQNAPCYINIDVVLPFVSDLALKTIRKHKCRLFHDQTFPNVFGDMTFGDIVRKDPRIARPSYVKKGFGHMFIFEVIQRTAAACIFEHKLADAISLPYFMSNMSCLQINSTKDPSSMLDIVIADKKTIDSSKIMRKKCVYFNDKNELLHNFVIVEKKNTHKKIPYIQDTKLSTCLTPNPCPIIEPHYKKIGLLWNKQNRFHDLI